MLQIIEHTKQDRNKNHIIKAKYEVSLIVEKTRVLFLLIWTYVDRTHRNSWRLEETMKNVWQTINRI